MHGWPPPHPARDNGVLFRSSQAVYSALSLILFPLGKPPLRLVYPVHWNASKKSAPSNTSHISIPPAEVVKALVRRYTHL